LEYGYEAGQPGRHLIRALLPRGGLDWRSARVYFPAFLNPSRGQPVQTLTARVASLCHRR